MSQREITPVMYAFDQRRKDMTASSNIDEILKGYDRSEVLYLTFKGDLVEAFGAEGDEYDYEDAKLESMGLKDSTASKYILKNEDGSWALNSNRRPVHRRRRFPLLDVAS